MLSKFFRQTYADLEVAFQEELDWLKIVNTCFLSTGNNNLFPGWAQHHASYKRGHVREVDDNEQSLLVTHGQLIFDHVHYARWLSVHLFDLLTLHVK